MTVIQAWCWGIGFMLACLSPVAAHLFGNFHIEGFGDSPIAWAHEKYLIPSIIVMVGFGLVFVLISIIFQI